MLQADEALRMILDAAPRLGTERVKLIDASGRTLAEDVVSEENIPPFDNSSMDGYAVIASNLDSAGKDHPVVLSIVGESSAGNVWHKKLRKGETVRIMTGGKIPSGADAVIPFEQVASSDDGHMEVKGAVKPGQYVRGAGEDIKPGETALRAGELIQPPHVGVLASLGWKKVRVSRSPRVNILATGDEIVDIDEDLEEGQIRNSSSYALHGYVHASGGTPALLGISSDKRKQTTRRIREGLGCDMLLITGGVSVGKYDFVKAALENIGVDIKFWKVNIKPGKPLLFGRWKNTLVFGLPGNPASTMVTFLQFVRPAIDAMLGRSEATPFRLSAILDQEYSKTDGKRHFLRGSVIEMNGQMHVSTSGSQSSGVMSSMARANCLIIIPEGATKVHSGEHVVVEVFR